LRIITGKQFPADNFRRESYGQSDNYLSPAPHAAGFSSGLSEAPHAAGFSAGLSEAPHAAGFSEPPQDVPQAEAAAVSAFFVQPNKFESAIFHDLLNVFSGLFPALCDYHYTLYFSCRKYALFCNCSEPISKNL
jgi:hypothetical protein